MEPSVELLDRQVAFLLKQSDDVSFLIQVEPFLRALRTDDRLASYLDDLRDELVAAIQALEKVDAELVPELVVLRDELVALRPEADDSAAEVPVLGGGATAIGQVFAHRQTLAYFDSRAAGEPEAFNDKGQGGKASVLLSILQSKDAQYAYNEEAAAREAAEAVPNEPPDNRESPPKRPQRRTVFAPLPMSKHLR